MAKTILTYSWLAKRCMSLFRRDRAEYERMINEGSDAVVRGLLVRWQTYYQGDHRFVLAVASTREPFANVHGALVNGHWHTWIEPTFTASQYKKRLVEKYLPISLPQGVRSRKNPAGGDTECIFYNADGSVADRGDWMGARRGRAGRPSKHLFLRDSTGDFCSRLPASDGGSHDWHAENRLHLGWFDQASRNRKEWLDSIHSIPSGLVNHDKMLKVAAQAYLACHRLCENYPAVRMALFPAVKYTGRPLTCHRHGDDERLVTLRWVEGQPEKWALPEVLAYWPHGSRFIRLSMTVPPHGCTGLDPTGRHGQLCSVADHSQGPRPPRYAYNDMLAFRSDVPVEDRRTQTGYAPYQYGQTELESVASWESQRVFWPDNEDKVLAHVMSSMSSDEIVEAVPATLMEPVAMRPEQVLLAMEEKLLMESLPLC